MPYNPYFNQLNAYQPIQTGQYQYAPSTHQQPVHGFVYVTGLEGAKAYQMPPNSEMPLFDSTNDGVMFIKKTDGAGYPTITVVDCTERKDGTAHGMSDYVTHDEFKGMLADVNARIAELREAFNGSVPKAAGTAFAHGGEDTGAQANALGKSPRHISEPS